MKQTPNREPGKLRGTRGSLVTRKRLTAPPFDLLGLTLDEVDYVYALGAAILDDVDAFVPLMNVRTTTNYENSTKKGPQ